MPEVSVIVKNEVGLHARPAALFVQTANRFKQARIEIVKDGVTRDAKSILGVLTLGVNQGSQISIRADGPEAELALQVLADLINRNFHDAAGS